MTDSSKKDIKPLAILIFAVIIIWIGFPFSLRFIFPEWKMEMRGQFGDMFGVLNALFSGLAFAGVIFAILLQRKELELQRKELILTRTELKGQKEQLQGQREQLEAQNKTMQKQNFENTFFQMLSLHNEMLNTLNYSSRNGRECFEPLYREFHGLYINLGIHDQRSERQKIETTYQDYWERTQQKIGHYIRYLYNIFLLVKNSDMSNKELYANIMISQLSKFELLLIFYTGLFVYEGDVKTIIEEFAVFNELTADMLIRKDHQDLYDKSAFGN